MPDENGASSTQGPAGGGRPIPVERGGPGDERFNRIVLRPAPFAVRLVDEEGEPKEGVAYVLTTEDGTELSGETDAQGWIRRWDVPAGRVSVRIDDETLVVGDGEEG
ncbi:MAG: hypothetical protein JW819_05805 [Candidatus Krumholzibacteriota bacterium]|nr:hypothetical protein [Candidatus Krumholzibacteriota bacterium]